MEKFYIVEKDSELAKDYLEYLASSEKFANLFKNFASEFYKVIEDYEQKEVIW